MRGRPREFDRDHALSAAMLLFWRKGFHATSLRDLGDALNLRMPSLYAAFGSKEALYVEAISLYMTASQTLFWQQMEGLPPRAAIESMLRAVARELTSDIEHPVGCMVSLAATDEDMPAAVATAIRQARRDWLAAVRKPLTDAVAAGTLPADTDTDGLSRFYIAIVQSIGIQAHDGASCAELERMIDIAMTAWPLQGATADAVAAPVADPLGS